MKNQTREELKTKLVQYLHWSASYDPPDFQTISDFYSFLDSVRIEAPNNLVDECWNEAEILKNMTK